MEDASPELDLIFVALSHSVRRRIIKILSFRPSTPKELASELGLSLQMTGKHLDALSQAKLIRRQKTGRTNFVGFRARIMRETQEWINQFRTEWSSDQETLENYIAFMTSEDREDENLAQ
jgi:DNA-binding MarR family transcriptional regulator